MPGKDQLLLVTTLQEERPYFARNFIETSFFLDSENPIGGKALPSQTGLFEVRWWRGPVTCLRA